MKRTIEPEYLCCGRKLLFNYVHPGLFKCLHSLSLCIIHSHKPSYSITSMLNTTETHPNSTHLALVPSPHPPSPSPRPPQSPTVPLLHLSPPPWHRRLTLQLVSPSAGTGHPPGPMGCPVLVCGGCGRAAVCVSVLGHGMGIKHV